jgi:hypothetical protein
VEGLGTLIDQIGATARTTLLKCNDFESVTVNEDSMEKGNTEEKCLL